MTHRSAPPGVQNVVDVGDGPQQKEVAKLVPADEVGLVLVHPGQQREAQGHSGGHSGVIQGHSRLG